MVRNSVEPYVRLSDLYNSEREKITTKTCRYGFRFWLNSVTKHPKKIGSNTKIKSQDLLAPNLLY